MWFCFRPEVRPPRSFLNEAVSVACGLRGIFFWPPRSFFKDSVKNASAWKAPIVRNSTIEKNWLKSLYTSVPCYPPYHQLVTIIVDATLPQQSSTIGSGISLFFLTSLNQYLAFHEASPASCADGLQPEAGHAAAPYIPIPKNGHWAALGVRCMDTTHQTWKKKKLRKFKSLNSSTLWLFWGTFTYSMITGLRSINPTSIHIHIVGKEVGRSMDAPQRSTIFLPRRSLTAEFH